MKSFILTLCALGIFTTSFSQNAAETAIKSQVQAFVKNLNDHQFSEMDSYCTTDIEWVNLVGMWWKGLNDVKKAHQIIFDNVYKNVVFEHRLTEVRFLTNDVAVAHLLTYNGAYTTPSGSKAGNDENLMTLVFVLKNEKWLLSSAQNVVVNAAAVKHNPIK